MNTANRRVWFITGASQGLGRALTEAVLEHGDQVAAGSRRPDALQDLVRQWSNRILPVTLDVTKEREIHDSLRQAVDAFGRIDVLVNNAGYGLLGAVEEVSDREARGLFDVNVFGLLAVTRAVLPFMRERRSGHILNLSSVAGIAAGTGSGLYAASKFAVEGLSEALAAEVSPLGIKVTIVEPGQFRTNFLGDSIRLAEKQVEEYQSTSGAVRQALLQNNGLQQGDPFKAAEAMIQVVQSETPTLRLPLGEDAIARIRQKIKSVESDVNAWESIALNTKFQ